MTLKEQLARWYIRKYLPNHHLHYSPGKHPLTRMKLNEAVSKNMDKYQAQGFEDYEAKREEA